MASPSQSVPSTGTEETEQTSKSKMAAKIATWNGASYRMDLGKDDPNYGTPVAGSKTDIRGRRAGTHISHEIMDLIEIIYRVGSPYPGSIAAVCFGPLFELYTRISSKLVGMLVRARRHGLVKFEGEMLYQGQDNDVIIRLVKIPPQLMEVLGIDEDNLEKQQQEGAW